MDSGDTGVFGGAWKAAEMRDDEVKDDSGTRLWTNLNDREKELRVNGRVSGKAMNNGRLRRKGSKMETEIAKSAHSDVPGKRYPLIGVWEMD